MGLGGDGRLGGSGGVLMGAAEQLSRMAASALPIVLPGLDSTAPSAPDPGSPPSVSLHLAFAAIRVLLGPAGGQHGA